MRIVRWLIVVGLLLAALFAAPAAHAQYVGGKPPTVGGTDNGAPTQVLGQQFQQQLPATPVLPILKHESSSNGLIGPLTLGDIITGAGVIAALGLLWFFLVWRRRREDEEEEGLGATA